MPDKDFNKREGETPTAAHTWDEQFKGIRDGGHKGPPPREEIEARIAQLEAAIVREDWPPQKTKIDWDSVRKGWKREIEWRRKQLEQLMSMEDSDVGDTEPAE